jgi:hypothetical protein
MTTPLIIGAFPTAKEVREIPSKKQKRIKELEGLTTVFITDVLKAKIIDAQENDCEGCTCLETIWFKFPDFVKDFTERVVFVSMLMNTLKPLGYGVREETDSAQDPTGNVVVTWKDTKGLR